MKYFECGHGGVFVCQMIGGYLRAPLRDSAGRYICEECEKRFESINGLSGHKRFCTGVMKKISNSACIEDLMLKGGEPTCPAPCKESIGVFGEGMTMGDVLQLWTTVVFLQRFMHTNTNGVDDSGDPVSMRETDEDKDGESDENNSIRVLKLKQDALTTWDQIRDLFLMDGRTAAHCNLTHSIHVAVVKIIYDDLYDENSENNVCAEIVNGIDVYDGRPLHGYWG